MNTVGTVKAPGDLRLGRATSKKRIGKTGRATRRSEPVALLVNATPDAERPISFALFNPRAQRVFLAGSFNDWNPTATELSKEPTGRWTVTLMLRPRTYEYKYVVDGKWEDDPMAARFVANPFGSLNSVIVVKQ